MGREKKWTPGPWELREHPHDEDFFVEAKNHGYEMPYDLDVCGEDYNGFGDEEVRRANYSLISAAPELVEALESLIEIEDNDELCDTHEHYNESYQSGELRDLIVKARSALAKAYGETP